MTTAPRLRLGLAVAAVLAGLAPPLAASTDRGAWFSSWSRPQSVVVAAAADLTEGGRGPGPLVDESVRDVVRLSRGGSAVRVRLSNRYGATLTPEGTVPLQVTAVTIAERARGAAVVARTLRGMTFGGRPDVTIAPGATVVSDPVRMTVADGTDVAVSLHVDVVPLAPQHGASFVTSYVSPVGSGDHTRDVAGDAYSERTLTTLVLTGVDVRSTTPRGVVAATGGSVVDGFGTEPDTWTDWPSWLSRRIGRELPVRQRKSVVNNGLGGTTASRLCALPGTGPSVEERVSHDSLELAGISDLVVYAGTNDLGDGCTAGVIIDAFRSIVTQAHTKGVRVLISTITPRASYTALQNAEREKVNAWVRHGGTCSGECDHSLDFDVVVRDPANHDQIDPRLDSGDGIHPTGEGYRRIAASIPLSALL